MNQPLQLEHLAAFSSRLSTESLIDDLAPTHSAKQDQIHASIISTLLALMDRLDGRSQIVVIGATNSPEASSRHSHDADADEDDDVTTKLSRTSGTLLATERRIRRVRNPLPPPPPPQQGPKIQGPPSAPNASPDVMLHEPPRKKRTSTLTIRPLAPLPTQMARSTMHHKAPPTLSQKRRETASHTPSGNNSESIIRSHQRSRKCGSHHRRLMAASNGDHGGGDPARRRPGWGEEVEVGEAEEAMGKWQPTEKLKGLAKLTKGYGEANLRALCTEAALNVRRYTLEREAAVEAEDDWCRLEGLYDIHQETRALICKINLVISNASTSIIRPVVE
ncbi:hypothetical protein D9615_005529 [Tricholomella constricta]|uniref:ATPase AAA-type core domain-containing protein n=1 Tax=Tricholomella constricta TaxID=117010 RepID=A0A8H5M543_9AGAR|nr:hypothetical protein D9615_005529 [Tricholomella constricta]